MATSLFPAVLLLSLVAVTQSALGQSERMRSHENVLRDNFSMQKQKMRLRNMRFAGKDGDW
jgi:hypothetical protein